MPPTLNQALLNHITSVAGDQSGAANDHEVELQVTQLALAKVVGLLTPEQIRDFNQDPEVRQAGLAQ